jgi:hypothetical protein
VILISRHDKKLSIFNRNKRTGSKVPFYCRKTGSISSGKKSGNGSDPTV